MYFSSVICRPHCKFLRKPLNIKLTCVDKKLVWNSRMIYIMYCTGKNCCKNLQISKHRLEYNEREMTITNQWKVFSIKMILCWIWKWTSKTLLKYIMTSKDFTHKLSTLCKIIQYVKFPKISSLVKVKWFVFHTESITRFCHNWSIFSFSL